jgi:zinc protease
VCIINASPVDHSTEERVMTRRATLRALLFAAVFGATTWVAAAPQAQNPLMTAALSAPIPVDPRITVGTLPNGLRYYVRSNQAPGHRAELRLVVRAGSVLEADDQQGLAHFVEHMAFNGTEHFPKNEIVQFIESLGMRFGADLNAYTSFDETVYTLTVPTDQPETMDRALLILEDWAHNVTFDTSEIDRERGVVMEEWRLRRGAGARMAEKELPVLLKGSRYAERVPIGKTDVIQGFKPDRLKQFYKDWYRPDLMAVVAVGDFNRESVETMIKAHFGSITAPASERPRPTFDVPEHAGTVFAIATDKEETSASVEVDTLLPARDQGTVGVYRQEIVDRLFAAMLGTRFAEMTQKPDAPFLAAGANRAIFLARTREKAAVTALVKEDGIDKGLDAMLGELERVTRFGFTQSELDRQKQTVVRAYERMMAESPNRSSASRADEYIRNFLERETLPTNMDELVMQQRFTAEIALPEVNRIASDWFPDRNRLVLVNAPQKPGLVIPDEKKLAAVIKGVASKDLKPYVDVVGGQPLVESAPKAGAVTSERTNELTRITEWTLSNGATVLLKPTMFRADEVVFRATSPGGTSLVSDQDYPWANAAAQVVSVGGLGQFNSIDLRKVLTGKVATVRPSIGELQQGMSGSSSSKDLDTLFQLIYLNFTQPRADPAAVGAMASQVKALLLNQSVVPDYAFAETLQSTLAQNHLRRRLTTPASVDAWNLDKSMAFYKDRFADASAFTFVFVGAFDPAAMRPLVEEYIGSLPSLHRTETWKDVGARTPDGVIEKRVEKGIEPKSQAAIVFTGPFVSDMAHQVAIRSMAMLLQTRLLEAIRQELGGTYSIIANATTQKQPNAEYTLGIQFGCDPKRTDDLVTHVFQEIDRLKTDGPTEQQVADVKEQLSREFEQTSRNNSYLLGQIVQKYEAGEDLATIWSLPDHYARISAATIQDAARTYLNQNRYVKVTLFPEKK